MKISGLKFGILTGLLVLVLGISNLEENLINAQNGPVCNDSTTSFDIILYQTAPYAVPYPPNKLKCLKGSQSNLDGIFFPDETLASKARMVKSNTSAIGVYGRIDYQGLPSSQVISVLHSLVGTTYDENIKSICLLVNGVCPNDINNLVPSTPPARPSNPPIAYLNPTPTAGVVRPDSPLTLKAFDKPRINGGVPITPAQYIVSDNNTKASIVVYVSNQFGLRYRQTDFVLKDSSGVIIQIIRDTNAVEPVAIFNPIGLGSFIIEADAIYENSQFGHGVLAAIVTLPPNHAPDVSITKVEVQDNVIPTSKVYMGSDLLKPIVVSNYSQKTIFLTGEVRDRDGNLQSIRLQKDSAYQGGVFEDFTTQPKFDLSGNYALKSWQLNLSEPEQTLYLALRASDSKGAEGLSRLIKITNVLPQAKVSLNFSNTYGPIVNSTLGAKVKFSGESDEEIVSQNQSNTSTLDFVSERSDYPITVSVAEISAPAYLTAKADYSPGATILLDQDTYSGQINIFLPLANNYIKVKVVDSSANDRLLPFADVLVDEKQLGKQFFITDLLGEFVMPRPRGINGFTLDIYENCYSGFLWVDLSQPVIGNRTQEIIFPVKSSNLSRNLEAQLNNVFQTVFSQEAVVAGLNAASEATATTLADMFSRSLTAPEYLDLHQEPEGTDYPKQPQDNHRVFHTNIKGLVLDPKSVKFIKDVDKGIVIPTPEKVQNWRQELISNMVDKLQKRYAGDQLVDNSAAAIADFLNNSQLEFRCGQYVVEKKVDTSSVTTKSVKLGEKSDFKIKIGSSIKITGIIKNLRFTGIIKLNEIGFFGAIDRVQFNIVNNKNSNTTTGYVRLDLSRRDY